MKRFVLLLLVLCLLLSGCSIIPSEEPKEQTFKEVGITITAKGRVVLLMDENRVPCDFSLNTTGGTLFFSHYIDQDPSTVTYEYLCRVWKPHDVDPSQILSLENGAFFVRLPESSPDFVECYYYIQQGAEIWMIQGLILAEHYDETETLAVLQSIRFSE